MKTVHIGVLVDDTGEKPRTIQHWSDLGILRAETDTDKKGRGNYRIYRADPLGGERTWALLASAYAKLRLPLGDIRKLIYGERLFHDPVELLDRHDPKHVAVAMKHRNERPKRADFVHPFEAAIAGERHIHAVIALRPNDPVVPIKSVYLRHVPRAGATFPLDERPGMEDWEEDSAIETFHSLPEAKQKDLMESLRARRTHERMLRRLMTDNPSAMILNLSKIFEPLRRVLPDEPPARGKRSTV